MLFGALVIECLEPFSWAFHLFTRMAYNKQHNKRFSSRFNTPGQFVPADEQQTFDSQGPNNEMQETFDSQGPNNQIQQTFDSQGPNNQIQQDKQESFKQEQETGMNVESENTSMPVMEEDESSKPYWMRSKLSGVKKISNRERRRRQNESLRRLLTPKNALMVLNEMMPNEQVANQFKVEQALTSHQYGYKASNNMSGFCADLTIDGNVYKGYGDNKLMARNAAAEQAIRDLIIKKMNKALNSDTGSMTDNELPEEETLPMIQLASFALHKLFTEWEYEGHKVPQLKHNPVEEAVKKPKELPANAASMHPCMLLTYMRPHLEYREVAVEGDRPQNMAFTIALEVDGNTYLGKGPNKKEARKAAAKAACLALFNVQFNPNAAESTPQTTN